MKKEDIARTAQSLRGIMNETVDEQPCWTDKDYRGLLRHQLDAPLKDDLGALFADAADIVKKEKTTTFGALLADASPSVDLLRMVRHFAKKMGARGDDIYPAALAKIIYFAAIAAAEIHAHARISRLSDTELAAGYRWASNQEWVDPTLKKLFEQSGTYES